MPSDSQPPSDPALASVSGSPAPIAKGMGQSDRCRFCGEFYEKAKPWICPGCWETVKAVIAEYPDELLKPALENDQAHPTAAGGTGGAQSGALPQSLAAGGLASGRRTTGSASRSKNSK